MMSISDLIVLYVEDDRRSRMVIEVLLTEMLNVASLIIFENSKDFVDKINKLQRTPNLVFLDVRVQPLDGFQMLQHLRNQAVFEKTMIIALTANVMAHDIEKLKSAGFDGLIGKPILEEIFPQLLDKMLNGESVWYIP